MFDVTITLCKSFLVQKELMHTSDQKVSSVLPQVASGLLKRIGTGSQ